MTQAQSDIVRISVRSLVEFLLRSGDIDNRFGTGRSPETMLAGSRIHRRIQKSMGPGYEAEVPLKRDFPMGEGEDAFSLRLEGRADGIYAEDGIVWIDEIKSMYADVTRFTEPVPVHQAQALCYAWIVMQERMLGEVGIQMTYCRIETEETKIFKEIWGKDRLEAWFTDVIKSYEKWVLFLFRRKKLFAQTASGLEFPFPYRPGQRDLVVAAYRSMKRAKHLFVQAPTGIGKTMSVLFPAVRAMGEGIGEKIFYLTARNVTRGVAEESFAILREKGLHVMSITLSAKEKLCPLGTPECNPDACPMAKGHFDRVNDVLWDLLQRKEAIGREDLLEAAREGNVCPFELGLDASEWVEGVICDYNYVFDPDASLKRFFADSIGGRYLFLVDEAHNLVDRARDMYSAILVKEDFLKVRREIKEKAEKSTAKLCRNLDRCNKVLLEYKRETEGLGLRSEIHGLALALQALMGEMEDFRDNHPHTDLGEAYRDLFFAVRHFLGMYENAGEDYRIYGEFDAAGQFLLHLYCVDPSENLKMRLEKSVQTVFFSATMLPIRYHRELLGGSEDDYSVYVPSPFAEEKRRIAICRDVSSRYTRRGEDEYRRIAEEIRIMATAHAGHYLAFFPSYRFLENVASFLQEEAEGKYELFCQTPSMTEPEKEDFLASYRKPEKGVTRLGLCVLGGAFSEGIDLKEDQLIGVAIVGPGLPSVCTEREVLRQYFEENGKNGFDYAYRFPGMNKVQQAAGRVIRTPKDRGVILLMDDRFTQSDNQDLFPREWERFFVTSKDGLGFVLQEFWSEDH